MNAKIAASARGPPVLWSQPERSEHKGREVGQQIGRRDPKALREPEYDRQTRHLRATLDLSNVSSRQTGCVREVLLRPSSLKPEAANGRTKNFCFSPGRHSCKVTIVAIHCRVTVVTMARRIHRPSAPASTAGKILGFRRERHLADRREICIELPEFLIVLLEHRMNEANDGASEEERVTISHFVEYQVAEMLSIRDVAEFEMEMPGFGEAVQDWLRTAQQ